MKKIFLLINLFLLTISSQAEIKNSSLNINAHALAGCSFDTQNINLGNLDSDNYRQNRAGASFRVISTDANFYIQCSPNVELTITQNGGLHKNLYHNRLKLIGDTNASTEYNSIDYAVFTDETPDSVEGKYVITFRPPNNHIIVYGTGTTHIVKIKTLSNQKFHLPLEVGVLDVTAETGTGNVASDFKKRFYGYYSDTMTWIISF